MMRAGAAWITSNPAGGFSIGERVLKGIPIERVPVLLEHNSITRKAELRYLKKCKGLRVVPAVGLEPTT
jgi:hypothetical protein